MNVVQNDEASVMETTSNGNNENLKSIQGILIEDKVLSPYSVQFDYNGFYVYRGVKKLMDKPTGMNECLQEIYKRKLADVNKKMTLKEFTEYSQELSQSIMDAQGTPKMMKGAENAKK